MLFLKFVKFALQKITFYKTFYFTDVPRFRQWQMRGGHYGFIIKIIVLSLLESWYHSANYYRLFHFYPRTLIPMNFRYFCFLYVQKTLSHSGFQFSGFSGSIIFLKAYRHYLWNKNRRLIFVKFVKYKIQHHGNIQRGWLTNRKLTTAIWTKTFRGRPTSLKSLAYENNITV